MFFFTNIKTIKWIFFTLVLFLVLCVPESTYAYPRRARVIKSKSEESFELIKDGQISVAILIPKKYTKQELEAAKTLSKYLRPLASGGKVQISNDESEISATKKITISRFEKVVEPTPNNPNFNGARKSEVRVHKNLIELKYSYEPRNAVGVFLKNLGYKFLAPTELGTEYPKKVANLKIPVQTMEFNPPLMSISFYPVNTKAEIEFFGLNGSGGFFKNFGHGMPYIFDKKTLQEHPEYAPILKKYSRKPNANINFTHPDTSNFVASKAIDFFKKKPAENFFSIGLDDSLVHDVRTPQNLPPNDIGREFPNYSNAYFKFANSVAKIVEEKYPTKFLTSLAYMTTEMPPDFPIQKNIVPVFTTDKSCYAADGYKARDFSLMRKWKNSGVKLCAMWSYFYGDPYFTPRNIELFEYDAILKMIDIGFSSYFAEVHTVWAYDAPKINLILSALNGSKENPRVTLYKFYIDYFKESADPMAEFFRISRSKWETANLSGNWLVYYCKISEAEIFDKENIEKMDKALSRAEALATDKKVKLRVDEVRKRFERTKAFYNFYAAQKELFTAKDLDRNSAAEFLKTIKTNFEKLQNLENTINETSLFPQHFSPYIYDRDFSISTRLLECFSKNFDENLESFKDIFSAQEIKDYTLARRAILGEESQKTLITLNFAANFFNPKKEDFVALPENIFSRYFPSKDSQFGIVKDAQNTNLLRTKNAYYSNITRTAEVEADALLLAEFEVEYKIFKYTSAYVDIVFFDESGTQISTNRQHLFPTKETQKRTIRILCRAPKNAKYASIKSTNIFLGGGGIVDVKKMSLREILTQENSN